MENNMRIMNIEGVDCYEKDGVAYLNLDAVARGLGFTREASSGNEVVRWERVERYLSELFVPTCGHEDYIPENIFYRLAMKAKNEAAEKFQAKIADEVIPAIRKNGIYATKSAMTKEILGALSPEMRAAIAVDLRVTKLERKIDSLKEDVQSDLQAFKDNLPILSVDAERITKAARKKGIECLDGKDSRAYKNKSLRCKLYKDMYHELNRQFGTDNYKQLKRNQVEQAIQILNSYKAPVILSTRIELLNRGLINF